MKLHNNSTAIILTIVGSLGILSASEIPTNSVELVSKLTIDADDQALLRRRFAIKADRTITEESRIELSIKYLIISQQYLKNRSMPAGEVVSNPPRPDGAVSGSDPNEIKDPAQRAEYIKLLKKYDDLSKAQSKYFILIQSRLEIASLLSAKLIEKTITPEAVAAILYRESRTAEEARDLMSIIDQAAVAKNQRPLPWPDFPQAK